LPTSCLRRPHRGELLLRRGAIRGADLGDVVTLQVVPVLLSGERFTLIAQPERGISISLIAQPE
jgi:hypothetical protein